jgi:adenylosuccinate synthase
MDNGHLLVDGITLHPWKLRQVPVAAVTNSDARLVIAAGSEIDPEVLSAEVSALDAAGYQVSDRLLIDRNATIIEQRHRDIEARSGLVGRIGSTGKGIGAARADRIMREAVTAGQWFNEAHRGVREALPGLQESAIAETAVLLYRELAHGTNVHVLIEGTQGYGLGLHTGHYPQTTSSDARAIDFLAMAGVNPWVLDRFYETADQRGDRFDVWVVLRTHPIRVAGNSGQLDGETTWRDLGLPEERTTVTNNVRRVGQWDPQLAADAVRANGGGWWTGSPVRVALTMVDHVIPAIAGRTDLPEPETARQLDDLLTSVAGDCGVRPTLVGTGPTSVIDLRQLNSLPDSVNR